MMHSSIYYTQKHLISAAESKGNVYQKKNRKKERGMNGLPSDKIYDINNTTT